MPYVPPWLNVEPAQFVQAAQAGARIGAELAGQASERGIASARNATALQESQMREGTALSGQQAEQALANARLQQIAQQQAQERALREWEVRQQIKRQQDTIAAENERAANALAERKGYGQSMLDIRREANRIAQQKADAAEKKPAPGDFQTVTTRTKEVLPSEQYTINEPAIPSRFFGLKAGSPATTLSTTNSADLMGLPAGSTISTNKIPGVPATSITRRVPIGGDVYMQPFQQPATPSIPPSHVNYLKSNPTPSVISDFNTKYGEGAADQFLQPDESQADTP